MSNMPTAAEMMERMNGAFQPDKAAGIDAVVQYVLTGEGGGEYVLSIKDGKIDIQPGKAPAPKMTMTMDVKDFQDMTSGKANPMALFSSGKLKVGGDMMFAMKLAPLFGRTS